MGLYEKEEMKMAHMLTMIIFEGVLVFRLVCVGVCARVCVCVCPFGLQLRGKGLGTGTLYALL